MALRLKAYANIDGKEIRVEASGADVPGAMLDFGRRVHRALNPPEQPKAKIRRPRRRKEPTK